MVLARFHMVLSLAIVGSIFARTGAVTARPAHCRKDCKQDITGCLRAVPKNTVCAGTKPEKRACRKAHAAERAACRGLLRRCKQQNPETAGICVAGGPTTSMTLPGTSSCGTFLLAWGTPGSDHGQFNHPTHVATAGGDVYVGEGLFTDRMQKFDANGTFYPWELQTRELPALHETVAVTDSAGGDADLHLSRAGLRTLSRDDSKSRYGRAAAG